MSTEKYIGDELQLFAQASNWKSYWSSKIEPLLQGPVLEVGAGIGSNLKLLRRRNQSWVALEPDAEQVGQIADQFDNLEHEEIQLIGGTLEDVSSDQRFNTIIYIDVLEHIQHDQDEVQKAYQLLNSGGRLIVVAPAHNRLYSPFDKAVGHFRRYDKAMLKATAPILNDQPAPLEALYYLDSVGYLASLLNAALLRQTMPTSRQIWVWDKLMVPLSKILDRIIRYRFGKTIVAIWKK